MTVHAERSAKRGVEARAWTAERAPFDSGPPRGPPLRVIGGLLLFCACATPLSSLTVERRVTTSVGAVTIRSAPASKPDDATDVEKALNLAEPRLQRWGSLDRPVEIHVLPTHGDLESAVRRRGYDWLRAWAQYDDVLLQAPSTWATSEHDVAELLAHELTHCLMYQKSGTPEDWSKKGIPLWFREGMATWTAKQGYRWMTLEDLARVYEEGLHHDPIEDAEALYQSRSAAVYAAAHYAFSFLMNRYGSGAVELTLRNMAKGESFDDAFTHGVGIAPARFTAEFKRYIVWRAFRGTGKDVRSTH